MHPPSGVSEGKPCTEGGGGRDWQSCTIQCVIRTDAMHIMPPDVHASGQFHSIDFEQRIVTLLVEHIISKSDLHQACQVVY